MRFLKWLNEFLGPADELRPDPHSGAGRYVRSFLVMRLVIGFIGMLLPFALWLIDWGVFHGYPHPRGSESIYYYSGMREVFTGSITTIAFFMLLYKIMEWNLDNVLTILAGLSGLMIVLLPTAPPARIQDGFTKPTNPLPPHLTPLQKALTQPTTHSIHEWTSGAFIFFLGCTSIVFGIREGRRKKRYDHPLFGATFWRSYHFAWVVVMVGAGVWIFVSMKLHHGHPYWALLLGEGLCAFAFGASWTAKGAEWRFLFGGSTAEERAARRALAHGPGDA